MPSQLPAPYAVRDLNCGTALVTLSPVITTQVELWSVAMAFLFSAGIGVFFGVYPAMKASRLDPIVALRHE